MNFSDGPAENYLMEGLKILRKRKNLTQKEVADAVGITFQTYSYYETGRTKPTPEMLCKLADFFGVTVDELLGRSSPLFDDARVERPEILDFYDQLTYEEQQQVIGYIKGILYQRENKRRGTA